MPPRPSSSRISYPGMTGKFLGWGGDVREPEVLQDTVGESGSGFSAGVGGIVGFSPASEESVVGFSLMARNSKVGRSMSGRDGLVTGAKPLSHSFPVFPGSSTAMEKEEIRGII